jgi:hypothetical protein
MPGAWFCSALWWGYGGKKILVACVARSRLALPTHHPCNFLGMCVCVQVEYVLINYFRWGRVSGSTA